MQRAPAELFLLNSYNPRKRLCIMFFATCCNDRLLGKPNLEKIFICMILGHAVLARCRRGGRASLPTGLDSEIPISQLRSCLYQ
jgi:hypothetical protein